MTLLASLTAAGLAYVLTWAVRWLAPRAGLVDRPRPDRWHRRPVPRLGGVAVYLGFTVPLLLFWEPASRRDLAALLLGGGAIFLAGLADDLLRLESRPKLLLLVLCALVPAAAGVRFELFDPLLGVPLAVFWVLGATNAFNWLDNMDGVAAGVAVVAAAALVAFSVRAHGEVAMPGLLLGAAALGFLAHNFPPARVFLGDCGSGFLGLTLAVLALIGSYQDVSNVLLTVLVPGLILAVPIFDTATVTVLHVLNRRPLFLGGRDHPAHRLVALGLSERRVVLLLYGLSAVAAALGLAASSLDVLAGMTVTVVLALGFVALGLVLAEVQVYEGEGSRNGGVPPSVNGADGTVTVLPAPFLHKKWVAVMLADLVLVATAFIAAHLLRFEGHLPSPVALGVARALPAVLAAKVVGLWVAGAYRGAWRYAGALDLVRLVEGVTLGAGLGALVLAVWTRFEGLSRAALVLDWLLAVMLLASSRLSLRLLREYLAAQAAVGRPVLIFGAGRGGTLVLQEIRQNRALGYRPVGFVDDDPEKRGVIVQGLRVLGSRHELADLVRRYGVEEVLVAAPSAPAEVVEEVVAAARAAGARPRRVGLVVE